MTRTVPNNSSITATATVRVRARARARVRVRVRPSLKLILRVGVKATDRVETPSQ